VQISGDSPTLIAEQDLMDVGIVLATLNQSEGNRQFQSMMSNLSTAMPPPVTAIADSSSETTGHEILAASTTGPWASYVDMRLIDTVGSSYQRSQGTATSISLMTGGSNPGDGSMMMVNQVLNHIGCSIMVVNFGRSGTPMDLFIWGNQAWSVTATWAGSGTTASPFTYTPVVTSTMVRTLESNANLIINPNYNSSASPPGNASQILPGSVTITCPGGIVVNDSFSGYTLGATTLTGTLSGTGVDTANSSINYMTGVVNLVFLSGVNPGAPTAIAWTNMQQTVDGSPNAKTQQLNGFGVWQAFDQTCRFTARFGFTMALVNWVTGNIAEAGLSVATMAKDVGAKYGLVRGLLQGYQYAGLDANVAAFPMIIQPKARDCGYTQDTIFHLDIARASQINLWPGGGYALSFALRASNYYDDSVESTTSPHQNAADTGGRRIGERQGLDVVAAYTGVSTWNATPTWGTPTFSGGSPGAYTTMTIPTVGMPIGGSLTTDAANGGSNTALESWYICSAANAGSPTPTRVDNNAYAKAAISGSSVVITMQGANTLVGTEIPRYVVGIPGSSADPTPPGGVNGTSGVVPPPGLLYVSGGTVPATTYAPGLLMPPLFLPFTNASFDGNP
jgi:hypothetical protein